MDNINVFDNESIWIFQQMYEPLYTVTARRQERQALAGDELRPVARPADLHLPPAARREVPQRPADDVGRRQVLDRRGAQPQDRLGVHRRRDQERDRARSDHRRRHHQVPVGAAARRPRAVQQRDHAQGLRRQEPEGLLRDTRSAPARSSGITGRRARRSSCVKNPDYWQPGKPHLDSVTWTVVPTTPPASSSSRAARRRSTSSRRSRRIDTLKATPGITMTLFPSTRTDYMPDEREGQAVRRRPRAPRDLLRDRPAGADRLDPVRQRQPANSFMPPQVPYYDPNSPGLQYDMDKAKEELAQSSVPNGFTFELSRRLRSTTRRSTIAADPAGVAEAARHRR